MSNAGTTDSGFVLMNRTESDSTTAQDKARALSPLSDEERTNRESNTAYRSCCDSLCRWSTNRLPACEGLDDEHRRTTVAADEHGLNDGCGLIGLLRFSRFGYDVQQRARAREIAFAPGIGDQSIVTDAMKAAGQNVQQETAHELLGTERHRLVARLALGSVVLPAEAHTTFIEGDQPPVRDRHAVGIAG